MHAFIYNRSYFCSIWSSVLHLRLEQLYTTNVTSEFQALANIPAMQRRRLSTLAKIALNSAVQALQEHQVQYLVWASRYGDEQKTINILHDILQGQTPSPTQFSTSVHNAIAGLYSILYQDATPSTSLSCSWSEAMLEAYAWLKNQPNATAALVIYYDAPLPEIYQERQTFEAYSMAAIVALDHPNLQMNLGLDVAIVNKDLEQDAQEFISFWQDNKSQTASGMWQRC